MIASLAIGCFGLGWLLRGLLARAQVKAERSNQKRIESKQAELDKAMWEPHTYDSLSMDALVRYRGDKLTLWIHRKDNLGLSAGFNMSYNLAFECFEESNDHGYTWHPCGQRKDK